MTETRSAQAAPAPHAQVAGLAFRLHRVALGAFILDLLVVGIRLFEPRWFQGWAQVPEASLVLLGALTAASFFLVELPAQNVLLAMALIAALSLGADLLGVAAAGSRAPDRGAGNVTASLAWWLPLVHAFAILNARGVAQLVLRAWTWKPNYGLWVLGVTVSLALGFEMALAACVQIPGGDWRRDGGVELHGWYGTPWPAIAGWALALVVITALITPSLINKRPAAPEIQSGCWSPLLVWGGTALLLLAAAVRNGFWLAAGFIALVALTPALLNVSCGRQFHR